MKGHQPSSGALGRHRLRGESQKIREIKGMKARVFSKYNGDISNQIS